MNVSLQETQEPSENVSGAPSVEVPPPGARNFFQLICQTRKDRIIIALGSLLVAAVIGCVLIALHTGGHSGGGGAGNSTVTTTTTTKPPNTPTKGMSPAAAVAHLNKLYNGFKKDDDNSALGIYLYMATGQTNFWGNLFCSAWANPSAATGHTSCYNGNADCRMSVSLVGSQWMQQGGKIFTYGESKVGYVFNEDKAFRSWTKCSYIWDGASNERYNQGCGGGAPSTSCTENQQGVKVNKENCSIKDNTCAAWYNKCPSTGQTCTSSDPEVYGFFCRATSNHPSYVPEGCKQPYCGQEVPETHDGHAQCIYPGAAINFHGQQSQWQKPNYVRDMVKDRVMYIGDESSPHYKENLQEWNEVVLDLNLVIPDMKKDAALGITSLIYKRSGGAVAKRNAEAQRDQYCAFVGCAEESDGTWSLPVVMMDDQSLISDCPGGIFTTGDSCDASPSPSPPPSPSPSPPPSPSPSAAACSAHSACAKLQLEGNCCPDDGGDMLGCCSEQAPWLTVV